MYVCEQPERSGQAAEVQAQEFRVNGSRGPGLWAYAIRHSSGSVRRLRSTCQRSAQAEAAACGFRAKAMVGLAEEAPRCASSEHGRTYESVADSSEHSRPQNKVL